MCHQSSGTLHSQLHETFPCLYWRHLLKNSCLVALKYCRLTNTHPFRTLEGVLPDGLGHLQMVYWLLCVLRTFLFGDLRTTGTLDLLVWLLYLPQVLVQNCACWYLLVQLILSLTKHSKLVVICEGRTSS